jgi:hypothetical protein
VTSFRTTGLSSPVARQAGPARDCPAILPDRSGKGRAVGGPPQPRFGPWVADLDPAERLARTRTLRALAAVLIGPSGHHLVEHLAAAEHDPGALRPAAEALDALPALPRRRLLAAFASIR